LHQQKKSAPLKLFDHQSEILVLQLLADILKEPLDTLSEQSKAQLHHDQINIQTLKVAAIIQSQNNIPKNYYLNLAKPQMNLPSF
jgi:hypothetical protein